MPSAAARRRHASSLHCFAFVLDEDFRDGHDCDVVGISPQLPWLLQGAYIEQGDGSSSVTNNRVEERAALARIMELGLTDTFRMFEQPEKSYSWWDYRQAAFRRGMGLRIDLVLASKPLAELCSAAYIDVEPRRQQQPSDHTPVIAEFSV